MIKDEPSQIPTDVLVAAIVVILSFSCVVHFFVKPFMYRHEAVKTVKTVLNLWKNQNFTKVMDIWENPKNHPDIYNLLSYKILRSQFDKQDGRRHAVVAASLSFGQDSFLPNNDVWIFEVEKFELGWKVTDFYLERVGKKKEGEVSTEIAAP